MPYQGHQDECFSVQDKRFCYSDYLVTSSFYNSASHGGPIRAGIHVRIAYLGGTILRLQIQKNEVISPKEAAIAEQSAKQQYGSLTQNDPIIQRFSVAFRIAIVFLLPWANLRWRTAMRIWVRPPNKQTTIYIFRNLFGLGLLRSISDLISDVERHPMTKQTLWPVLLTAATMCCIVATITALSASIAKWR